ncbi:penicillin acylase family protein [Arcicella lustrica]|uniref:Penicillin acylase family protein n=1 Tax=Arcicella lustrica TaxID=2984196 RepID=A0ABU5SPA9_9BACT|nr:penicillin acylase family protein [Arcicella sp. DC25W]MEA5429074.1 penicillin acylase family protein [Arcicella sp. DC25W]
MKKVILLLFLPFSIFAQKFSSAEINRFKQQAQRVNIIRDNWGIPHIYGKSDADAVFGLLYAQCEDDFKRVEMNYIEKLGRISELKGESELYNDLQIRLLIDTTEAKADYQKAAPWLKKLLNAYADGINYYLYTHRTVKPAMLTRFQPWYPLLWTDGSIGAISTADLSIADLKNFYSGNLVSAVAVPKLSDHQTGSNGFAFSPKITASGNAILYINPHVTFYFRPEVQVVSEEGLNAYGAVTWGQMFVYQGFNPYCGWMHTSSNVDVADVYAEKIVKKGEKYFYEYEGMLKPVSEKKITISYQSGNELKKKTFKTYFTHHGPIMAKRDDKWLSLKSYNRSIVSLIQSWKRTKAKGFEEYKQVMALKANTSNNTVFADNKGNIAYWHGNYIPKRDNQYNWAKPVDGSIAATEWKGLHAVDETVHLYNPVNGWLQNCNSTPFSVAGLNSPKRENYPPYMAPDGENFRGVNAVRVLDREKKYTIDKVIEAGYDTYLSAFEILIPALIKTFEYEVKPNDSLYNQLKAPIEVLKKWDYHSSEHSVATTLAVEWAQKLSPVIQRLYIDQGETDQVENTKRFAANATVAQLMPPLVTVVNDLTKKFGTWEVAWGEINRFQRLNGDLQAKYNDNEPSVPVGFASALWGSLPSYNSRYYQGTSKRYGVGGNSFICAVEFGKKIKAKSLLAGGESGDPSSKHFNDQLLMYTKGKFKDVLFYKEDVLKNAEKTYHPGE